MRLIGQILFGDHSRQVQLLLGDVMARVGPLVRKILASRRNIGQEMGMVIDGLGFEVVNVTPAAARRIAAAYQTWGKGVHPAGLSFGDCFAYELAREHHCPLLFVGADFSLTDIPSGL